MTRTQSVEHAVFGEVSLAAAVARIDSMKVKWKSTCTAATGVASCRVCCHHHCTSLKHHCHSICKDNTQRSRLQTEITAQHKDKVATHNRRLEIATSDESISSEMIIAIDVDLRSKYVIKESWGGRLGVVYIPSDISSVWDKM